VHPDSGGVFLDGFAGLSFRAHEENVLAVGYHLLEELLGKDDPFDRFPDIDDVDEISLPEDVRLHLRIPSPDAVAEMDARVDQFFD